MTLEKILAVLKSKYLPWALAVASITYQYFGFEFLGKIVGFLNPLVGA